MRQHEKETKGTQISRSTIEMSAPVRTTRGKTYSYTFSLDLFAKDTACMHARKNSRTFRSEC